MEVHCSGNDRYERGCAEGFDAFICNGHAYLEDGVMVSKTKNYNRILLIGEEGDFTHKQMIALTGLVTQSEPTEVTQNGAGLSKKDMKALNLICNKPE